MILAVLLLASIGNPPAPPRDLTAVVDGCSTIECQAAYLVLDCRDQGWKGTRTWTIEHAPTEYVASYTEIAEVRCSALRAMFSDSEVAQVVDALYPIEDLPEVGARPIARIEVKVAPPVHLPSYGQIASSKCDYEACQ